MLRSLGVLKIRVLALSFLVGLLLVVAPGPADTEALAALQQAAETAAPVARGQGLGESEGLAAQASHQAAEAAYWRAIERRPLDPQLWRQLGDLYAVGGRLDDALYAYGQALQRGDDAAALDRSLARLYAALGDMRRSVHHWDRYLARHPSDRAARLDLACTAIQLAEWIRARSALEQLLADDPNDAVARAWLGLLLFGPDPTAGMPHLQRAADDPALSTVLTSVFAAERLSAGVDDPAYRSALLGVALLNLDLAALRPSCGPDCIVSEWATEELRRKAIAALSLRSLLAATYRNPHYADAYAYLGQAFDELGWSGWARASLEYALRLAPQSPVARTLMGLYWDRQGVAALARWYYEGAYSHDQDSVALCLEIAAAYAAEGEYTAAEVWLHFARQIAPDDPAVWKTLAHFYLNFGIDVGESGLAAARRLLELAPTDASAHDLLGWAYFLIAEHDLAEVSLTQALALDPTLASAHYHLGRLYAQQGHYAQAAREYYEASYYDQADQLTSQVERAWSEMPPVYRNRP